MGELGFRIDSLDPARPQRWSAHAAALTRRGGPEGGVVVADAEPRRHSPRVLTGSIAAW